MENLDASDLSDLISQTYKIKINIPYQVMQDQRLMEISIFPEETSITKEMIEGCYSVCDLEVILNDLCFREHLKEGEYLMRFDD